MSEIKLPVRVETGPDGMSRVFGSDHTCITRSYTRENANQIAHLLNLFPAIVDHIQDRIDTIKDSKVALNEDLARLDELQRVMNLCEPPKAAPATQ